MFPQRSVLKTRLQVALTAGICVILSACGGGGDNNANTDTGPVLDVAASSPGLEISMDTPASSASANTTSNATGYAFFDGASDFFLSSGGNPDGLQGVNYNSANGRIDVAVNNAQVPGIYRLAVNAQDNAGTVSSDVFEVLVYPDGQANVSSGYSANLTATTEVNFNNSAANPYTANVVIPPRLNITYPANMFSPNFFQFGIPSNPPSVSPSTFALSNDGITVNSVAVDNFNDLVLNITVNPAVFHAMNDINPLPSSGGFLMQMNVDATFNGHSPNPYMEVFYVTPNVAL